LAQGATRPTKIAGEFTALIRAFNWILAQPIPRVERSQGYNIYTKSDYSEKCLLFPRKTPHSNRQLIQQARQFFYLVRTSTSIAIICSKAHSRSIPTTRQQIPWRWRAVNFPWCVPPSPCLLQVHDSGTVGVFSGNLSS